MGKIKKILENELVGGTRTTDVYPVTSTKAVYDENNERLDNILGGLGDKLGILKNAGYLYAGIATPTTDPSTLNTKVFYIANGKGTYEKFDGINVTEDEVVILYYDTTWHKVATGIASQEKLSELEGKLTITSNVNYPTESTKGVIIINTGKFTHYDDSYDGKLLDISLCDKVIFTTRVEEFGSAYAFLVDNELIDGQSPNYAEGYSTVIELPHDGSEVVAVVPNNASYMWVYTLRGIYNVAPTIKCEKSIKSTIQEINVDLSETKKDFEQQIEIIDEHANTIVQDGKVLPVKRVIFGNKMSLTLGYEDKTMEDIAFGNYTYRDIFQSSRKKVELDFDNGTFAPARINAGNPIVSNESHFHGENSLKVFGTSSQQLSMTFPIVNGHYYWFSVGVYIPRYTNGWAGVLWDNKVIGIQGVNSSWETISSIYISPSTNDASNLFLGSGSSANLDGYVDDVIVIDITDLFADLSTSENIAEAKSLMELAYSGYLDRKYNQLESLVIPLIGNGEKCDKVFVASVLDASSTNARFSAMRQLLDIAVKKSSDPSYEPLDSDFTEASKGVICEMPLYPSMYDSYPFDVIYAKNADIQSHPASTTKVMNLITAMDYIYDIKEQVTIISSDIESDSGFDIYNGDIMSVEDLMFGMMIPSSNTCAKALARIAGQKSLQNKGVNSPSSQDCIAEFLLNMNTKASSIGMVNSIFTSVSGVDSEGTNLTTAMDMLRFTIAASSYPQICRVWNKNNHTIKIIGNNARDVELVRTDMAAVTNAYNVLGSKTGSLYYDSYVANSLVMVARHKKS